MKEMYDSLHDPDERDKARRAVERTARKEERMSDTGLSPERS